MFIGRAIVLKAYRSLFGRIFVMAQGRNLKMMNILSHPQQPLSWALLMPDEFLRKTNNATLAICLSQNVTETKELSDHSTTVIGG